MDFYEDSEYLFSKFLFNSKVTSAVCAVVRVCEISERPNLKQNGPVEITRFWKIMNLCVSGLTRINLEFVSVPINTVDAEHSFSVYKNGVSNRCHKL